MPPPLRQRRIRPNGPAKGGSGRLRRRSLAFEDGFLASDDTVSQREVAGCLCLAVRRSGGLRNVLGEAEKGVGDLLNAVGPLTAVA